MKRLFAIVLVLLLLFSGCGKAKTLGFDISRGVTSFDPQVANGDSEFVIIKNCFRGLLDEDENGTLIPGVAKEYTVSEDGLIYTFYLEEGLFWNDGETRLTADDFVFAFERLFRPETAAPSRSDFFHIKNAESVLKGEKPVSSLGVCAVNNYTLEVTLESVDPLFLFRLTTAAAMPCNRSFFESTKGRYGLSLAYVLFNGAYYVRRINNTSYILSPNEQSPIVNKKYENIYLFVKDDPKAEAVARLREETVDAAVLRPEDKKTLEDEGFTIRTSESTVWMMAFNTEKEALSSGKIRRAIAYSVDRQTLLKNAGENFRRADAFVPPAVTLNGKSYRKTVGDSFSGFEWDPKLASELFKEGLTELGLSRFPALTILCTEEFVPSIGFLQKNVQDTLAVFINLIPVTEEELSTAVASGNYDLALIPLTPQYDNPSAVFSYFMDAENSTGYAGEEFSAAVKKALYQKDYDEMAQQYALAEQLLLQDMPALPIFYETSYFAMSPHISGLDYSVFGGHIVFRFCQ